MHREGHLPQSDLDLRPVDQAPLHDVLPALPERPGGVAPLAQLRGEEMGAQMVRRAVAQVPKVGPLGARPLLHQQHPEHLPVLDHPASIYGLSGPGHLHTDAAVRRHMGREELAQRLRGQRPRSGELLLQIRAVPQPCGCDELSLGVQEHRGPAGELSRGPQELVHIARLLRDLVELLPPPLCLSVVRRHRVVQPEQRTGERQYRAAHRRDRAGPPLHLGQQDQGAPLCLYLLQQGERAGIAQIQAVRPQHLLGLQQLHLLGARVPPPEGHLTRPERLQLAAKKVQAQHDASPPLHQSQRRCSSLFLGSLYMIFLLFACITLYIFSYIVKLVQTSL